MTPPEMRRSEITGLPVSAIPVEWLPLRLRSQPVPALLLPGEGPRLAAEFCGWWLCLNRDDVARSTHILYCSLHYGHAEGHVWMQPTPSMQG